MKKKTKILKNSNKKSGNRFFILLALFLIGLIGFVFYNKKQAKVVQATYSKKELKIVSEISDPGYFFLAGKGNVENVRMVGIVHLEGDIPGINERNNSLLRYHRFWKLYLTDKNPDDIIMAPEAGRDSSGKIGRMYSLGQPSGYLTPYLFHQLGMRKVVTCNTRGIITEAYQKEFARLMGLFEGSGGELEILEEKDNFGLPIVRIKKQPSLNPKDVQDLSTIWYPKYHLANSKFENTLVDFLNWPGVIPVVGAAHVLSIYKDGKVDCVSLTLSNEDLMFALKSIAIRDYYLKAIGR